MKASSSSVLFSALATEAWNRAWHMVGSYYLLVSVNLIYQTFYVIVHIDFIFVSFLLLVVLPPGPSIPVLL